jgi:exodeoxyribonuclease VII small subunit
MAEERMKKGIALDELLGASETKAALADLNFEGGLKLMEELVSKVESGTLPLDKAILSYEKGVQLVAHLRGLLAGAEEKLKVLQGAPGKKEKE